MPSKSLPFLNILHTSRMNGSAKQAQAENRPFRGHNGKNTQLASLMYGWRYENAVRITIGKESGDW
jgi:hypothetical protein